jgi:hypothetical protein
MVTPHKTKKKISSKIETSLQGEGWKNFPEK